MDILIDDRAYYSLWGIVAFSLCLNLAILFFLFYLWIDIYHRKWLIKMDRIDEKLRNLK